MKINMKFNKRVLIALVLLIGAIPWALSSVLPRSYSGTDLKFEVGSGPVTVTNPSDASVPVQLVGVGTRSYSVSSTIEGVKGSPTRQGNGSAATYLFEFDLPPGVSELTIARGTDVNFVSNGDANLKATVQPLGASDTRTTMIVAVVVILGALFYISRTNEHSWIGALRREFAAKPVAV